jgi:hypothetical protein
MLNGNHNSSPLKDGEKRPAHLQHCSRLTALVLVFLASTYWPMFLDYALNEHDSTSRRSTGILVDVDPAVSSEIDQLTPINFSAIGPDEQPSWNHIWLSLSRCP